MSSNYSHNHYVPKWYQRRFLPGGQSKFYYLDLRPDTVRQGKHSYTRRALLRWGPAKCFAQNDLYTVSLGGLENRDIEKYFFGKFDANGPTAVDHFSNYRFDATSHEALQFLLPYMSVQKLRTPKGLGWLQRASNNQDKNHLLYFLQQLQTIYCAAWAECIWQIADASRSPTKLIISDHPVVCYNRDCFPGSKDCSGFNDPDIRFAATHTYFPISIDKLLILTNLTWVRDPFQNPRKIRPNPKFFRPSIFNFQSIQVDRYLTEVEVQEVNYITKRSAFRYIAAAEEEWLHPERYLRSTHWRKLGDGYLLMPDPRHIFGGGEVVIGYDDGRRDAFSAYGHKPWQEGYKDEERDKRERAAMQKFKAEWAATYGPKYRGVVHEFLAQGQPPMTSMGEDYWRSECERDKKYLKFRGERSRRRRLRR